MDTPLKCNDLRCRHPCADQAVVTTCSHIFCLPCASRLGLLADPPQTAAAAPRDAYRICPACQMQLVNVDDAVVTALHPSEDYKTSILSGLSPAVIMECAGRGLAFWAYQMSQDVTYGEYLLRSMTDKFKRLEMSGNEVQRGLTEKNESLGQRLEAARADCEALMSKNEQLQHMLHENKKSYQQMSTLYNKLKQQQQAVGLEVAADQGAEEILMNAGSQQHAQQHRGGSLPSHAVGQGRQHRHNGSHGSNGSGVSDDRRPQRVNSWPQAAPSNYTHQPTGSASYGAAAGGYRPGISVMHTASNPPPSSQNRTRLPQIYNQPTFGTYNDTLRGGMETGRTYATDAHHADTQQRSQYGPVSTIQGAPLSGNYGLSRGVRMGRPPGSTVPLRRVSTRPTPSYVGMPLR